MTLAAGCIDQVVEDVDENVYAFSMTVGAVGEGEDIPVSLTFSDAGLSVDNKSWGDPWAKAIFHPYVYDSQGREVGNVLFSGPDGLLGDGSRLDIGKSRKVNIVMSHLRQGDYTLKVNMETRYTVPSWASASFTVGERRSGANPGEVIYVDHFTVPGSASGSVVDEQGNLVLDLKYYNESNPFRFKSVVYPANATDKQLLIESKDESILGAQIEGESVIVLIPRVIGKAVVNVTSRDQQARRTISVSVIESPDPLTGFTLPTDTEGGDPSISFDLGGRLALDINDFADADGNLPGNNPYEYTCKPIPSTGGELSLVASSDNESVVLAAIQNGSKLRLFPQGVGYATVTVSTSDGTVVRTLRVAVISKVNVTLSVEEGEPSEEDAKSDVFPCRISIRPDSKYIPKPLHMEMYGKATGRVDLTNKADYFLVDSLKNSRTAIYSYEEKVKIMVVSPSTPSGYDVYSRLMSKIAKRTVAYHHSDDYPHYYDATKNFRLYSMVIEPGWQEDFDTNLYRLTIIKKYDNPANRIYSYLH